MDNLICSFGNPFRLEFYLCCFDQKNVNKDYAGMEIESVNAFNQGEVHERRMTRVSRAVTVIFRLRGDPSRFETM
jgi:hypothetical protein